MWRVLVETALLFAAPFAAYILFHFAKRRWPFVAELWSSGVLSALTIAGLVAAILGAVSWSLFAPRQQGAYEPAHVEDGRLVPGRFK